MSLAIDTISNQETIMISETNNVNKKNNPVAEYANNFFSNISDSLKTGLAFVGLGAIENFGSRSFLAPGFASMGWDFYPQLPGFIHEYHSKVVWLNNIFSLSRPFSSVSMVITDELLFRGVLQEGLLKRVPEKILKKVAPEYAPYVNTTPAKIARITLSALAYSLAWASHNSCTHVIEFARGIIFGAIQEKTGTPLLSIAYRFGTIASNKY